MTWTEPHWTMDQFSVGFNGIWSPRGSEGRLNNGWNNDWHFSKHDEDKTHRSKNSTNTQQKQEGIPKSSVHLHHPGHQPWLASVVEGVTREGKRQSIYFAVCRWRTAGHTAEPDPAAGGVCSLSFDDRTSEVTSQRDRPNKVERTCGHVQSTPSHQSGLPDHPVCVPIRIPSHSSLIFFFCLALTSNPITLNLNYLPNSTLNSTTFCLSQDIISSSGM